MNFVSALNLPDCKASRKSEKWIYTCGLEMVELSIKGRDVGSKVRAFRDAHRVHHKDGHDPTATLYFTDKKAWCSCLHTED